MEVNQCRRSPSFNPQPRSLLFLKRPVAAFYRASVATAPRCPCSIDFHVHSHKILSAPTRTMSASNCSDGSNSRPQLFMEPFVSGFTRESRVPRHEKRKGPDLTRRFHDAYTSQACSDLRHSARHGENQVSLCDGKDRGHKVWQSKRHTPLYAKLRQSAIQQSLLPLPYVDLGVLKFQVLFQRKTTSTNPQSRANQTNKIHGKQHFGLQGRRRFFPAKKRIDSSRRDIVISLRPIRGHFRATLLQAVGQLRENLALIPLFPPLTHQLCVSPLIATLTQKCCLSSLLAL
jgi:hypothetical protein